MEEKTKQAPVIVIALSAIGGLAIAGGFISAIVIRTGFIASRQVPLLGLPYPATTMLLTGLATGIVFFGVAAIASSLQAIERATEAMGDEIRVIRKHLVPDADISPDHDTTG